MFVRFAAFLKRSEEGGGEGEGLGGEGGVGGGDGRERSRVEILFLGSRYIL
jgi:hypothetical protein